jgi:hypothetical protein
MLLILVHLLQAVTFSNRNLKLDYICYVHNLINVYQHLNYFKQCIDSGKLSNNIYSSKIFNLFVILKKSHHFKYGKNTINKIITNQ